MDQEILIEQKYSDADDKDHFKYLKRFFADDRYIKVDTKPVFIVFRHNLIPGITDKISKWRNLCRQEGIGEIYLMFIDKESGDVDPESLGFDASLEFQPNWRKANVDRNRGPFVSHILHKVGLKSSVFSKNRVVSYDRYIDRIQRAPRTRSKRFPGIFPMWDNSARKRDNATIFYGSTPDVYEAWVCRIVETFEPFSSEENFILICAWNEWAEGNHLEPCQKWGRAYLEATLRALKPYIG